MIKKDAEFIKRRNEKSEMQGTGKKVDYVPVVLPGGSVSFYFISFGVLCLASYYMRCSYRRC
jgi:hypothetical protein